MLYHNVIGRHLRLKALDTIGNYYPKYLLLGNQQWRAVDNIKHCEKRLPLK